MSIEISGIFTPELPEERIIVYLKVNYKDIEYSWQRYAPVGVNFDEWIESIEASVYAEIDFKENEWENLDPKTRQINDSFGGPTTVDISKDEIVRPDFPDYYAQRRSEYPSIGDQLDAISKGVNEPEYLEILQRIQEVKNTYPKPGYLDA